MRPPLGFLYDLFHKTVVSSMDNEREVFVFQDMFPLFLAVAGQVLQSG